MGAIQTPTASQNLMNSTAPSRCVAVSRSLGRRRVPAKHFEPQPDTLRVLVLSVLPLEEDLIPITELLERLYATWRLVYGGRNDDVGLLGDLGYSLDQDHDLTPNHEALVTFLVELGLATRFSDGLVMCHSKPFQS